MKIDFKYLCQNIFHFLFNNGNIILFFTTGVIQINFAAPEKFEVRVALNE